MSIPARGGAGQVLLQKRGHATVIVPPAKNASSTKNNPYRFCCERWRSPDNWLPVHVHRAKVASRPDLFGGVS